MKKVLLTGATGYIGGHLKAKLKQNYEVIAVSRNIDNKPQETNVTWRAADMFDLEETKQVMQDVDAAVYLVHSMMPNAKLTQANFEDMDALLADNFAKAAKANGVKHIVFMSGLIPDTDELSPHLRSRLECERILGSYGIPVSTLRAGLIIGSKGSSYPILKKLVERLPMLVLPSWAYNTTLPVAIDDVINGLERIVDRNPSNNESIDIGGPEHMTYKDLFSHTANVLDKNLPMLDLPIIPIWLSKYWVKLISGVPKEMVYPLMDSLIHDMTRDQDKTVEGISIGKIDYESSVERALEEEQSMQPKSKGKNNSKQGMTIKDVRAITRISIPEGFTMDDVANTYGNFLNKITFNMVESAIDENYFAIKLLWLDKLLLLLEKDHKVSDDDRVVYQIVGGELAHADDGGSATLEFRRIINSAQGLVALQEYQPTLPWIVYKFTQAKLHKTVMNLFTLKMKKLAHKKNASNNKMTKATSITVLGFLGIVATKKVKSYLAKHNNMSNAEL